MHTPVKLEHSMWKSASQPLPLQTLDGKDSQVIISTTDTERFACLGLLR